MDEFKIVAKTFQGLECVLAEELRALGAHDIEEGNRMVSFTGDKAMLYKANFHLRTAIRVLVPFYTFEADSADMVYEVCKAYNWERYLTVDSTFAVDAVVNSEDFNHSKFVAYRVKDAIADFFRQRYDRRPNVSVANPDITIHIHISHNECTLSLDSSGDSLHRRGYRQEQVEAPLNEVLAAGMILLTGWHGETDFIDPMCGSGTLPIEAALIARGIAPGLFRTQFAFEKWKDFDKDLFESIYNDDSMEKECNCKIYGYDIDGRAIGIAKRNAKAAGLADTIIFEKADIKDFRQPENPSIIVTNPPYGERIGGPDVTELYKVIGERFKNAFKGNSAWVISYHYECFDSIGLKPSAKIPLFNGQLPCELRKYEIFAGKYSDFRERGESLSHKSAEGRRGQTLRQRAAMEEKASETQENKIERRGERFDRRNDRPQRRDERHERSERRGERFDRKNERPQRRDERPQREDKPKSSALTRIGDDMSVLRQHKRKERTTNE